MKLTVTEKRVAEDDYETIIVQESETGTIIRTIAVMSDPSYAEVFAAAPELLEALEDVRRNLAKARNVGADRNALILDAEEIARAAIAKAKAS